jgi:two-component system OmpR family sensor kinase
MRTLFLRIFVAFWIAMVVILVGGIVVTAMVASARIQALENLQPSDLAIEAGEALEQRGLDGLKEWLTDVERERPGLTVLAIDPRGVDLLGREPPPRMQRRIDFLERRGVFGPLRPGGPPPSHRMHRWAPQVIASDGTPYTLLTTSSGRPPFGVLGTLDVPLALLALALVVSGLVSWWLARYVARPVTRLQASARAIAAGNLDARVGEAFGRRRDELGVLARDFDQMAERLRALIAARDVLLRDVSHELRSPLARLRVALGLARRPTADVARELDRIEREAERLDALIGEILHLSRLSSPEPGLQRCTLDLATLVDEVVADAALEGAEQNKTIVAGGVDRLDMSGDPDLLRSAIENVLRNALRFTAAGSSVAVDLARDGPSIVLTVTDQGPGVPAAELERIFEPFYRVASSRDRGSGGTGLGLAIAARVVALHGGRITARNGTEGGLVVEITLPVSEEDVTDPRGGRVAGTATRSALEGRITTA